MQRPIKTILGIDPGTLFMGYSLIQITGSTIAVLQVDVLKLSSKKDNYQRLQLINTKVCDLIKEYKPDEFAIEAPFFGKNVQSMLKLGRAQGVAIAAALGFNIPITEYSPKKVKQSITGNGNADKEQIWKMLQSIVTLPADKPQYFDGTDALAVALCHHFQSKVPKAAKAGPVTMKKKNSWDTFVKANEHRVVG